MTAPRQGEYEQFWVTYSAERNYFSLAEGSYDSMKRCAYSVRCYIVIKILFKKQFFIAGSVQVSAGP